MEGKFETEAILTLEENTKFQKVYIKRQFKRSKLIPIFIGVVVLALASSIVFEAYDIIIITLLYLGIFFIFLFIVMFMMKIKSRKIYDSYKIAHNLVQKYTFYDEYFMVRSEKGQSQINYTDLYEVVETNDNYYLFISKVMAFLMKKDNINNESEFHEFIKSKIKKNYVIMSNKKTSV